MSFVFSETWNATFEGVPPDTENVNLGASRIRALKIDIRQRMAIDHQWAGDANDGKHKQIQLSPLAPPTLDGGDGGIYANSVGGNTELFYKDSSGNLVQLTSGGFIASLSSFPAGTRLAFSNAVPPPGWTFIGGIHDRVMRIVTDGTGGAVGGNWTISGVTVATSTSTGTTTTTGTTTSTTTGTAVSLAGAVAVLGHTLTTAELPSLTFSSDYPTFTGTLNSSGSNPSSLITGTTTHSTNSIGGGNAHDHPVSNTMSASAVSNSVSVSNSTSNSTSTSTSTSTVSADGNWRPAFVNVSIGQKT